MKKRKHINLIGAGSVGGGGKTLRHQKRTKSRRGSALPGRPGKRP